MNYYLVNSFQESLAAPLLCFSLLLLLSLCSSSTLLFLRHFHSSFTFLLRFSFTLLLLFPYIMPLISLVCWLSISHKVYADNKYAASICLTHLQQLFFHPINEIKCSLVNNLHFIVFIFCSASTRFRLIAILKEVHIQLCDHDNDLAHIVVRGTTHDCNDGLNYHQRKLFRL